MNVIESKNQSKSKIIYFIRHGESQTNVARKNKINVNSWLFGNPILSEKGIEQSQLLSKITPSFEVDAIICSPLTRSIQTANYAFIGQRTPLFINSYIREIYWSDYESRGHPDILLRDPFKELDCFNLIDEESLLHCENGHDQYWQPKEEDKLSCKEQEKRSEEAVQLILPSLFQRKEKILGVVSHWGVIYTLFNIDPNNCDVVKILLKNCDNNNEKIIVSNIEQFNYEIGAFVKV